MSSEQKIYQIDGERAMISIGGKCPYKCTYCYSLADNFIAHQRRTPKQIISSLKNLPSSVARFDIGCDTETFIDEDEALELIGALAGLGKDIAFTTKKNLKQETIEKLKEIQADMLAKTNPNYMFACVSIIGFESALKLEPYAPDPEDRVNAVRRLHAAGIPTIVLIKPIIPQISDDEITRIFQETQDYCMAYVAGYMICDKATAARMNLSPLEKRKMEWSLDQRAWYYYADPRIAKLIEKPNVFAKTGESINHVKEILVNGHNKG